MYARVSTMMGKPENIDGGIRHLEGATSINRSKGWKGAYALVNRQTGKILTMTLWETKEDMENTVSEANQIRNKAADIAGAGSPVVEVYEVVMKP